MTDSAPASPAPAKRKAGPLAWILRIVVGLVGLVILILLIAFFARNTLVRAGVMRGGEYATGLSTALDTADLGLFQGSLGLSKLQMANAKDFKQPDFLTMNSCDVSVQPSSLLTETVVIPAIKIDGLEITLEQNGAKNNLSDIMAQIDKNTASTGSTANTSPGKKLKIGTFTLTHVKVHVRAAPLPNLDLDLGDIQMDDPTNPDGRPMKIADLIGKVLLHISQQLVNDPRLPLNIKDGMKNVTALVNNLQGDLNKDLKGFTNMVPKNLQDLGKNLPNAGNGLQNIGKDLQNAGKGMPDLLNNNKTQPK